MTTKTASQIRKAATLKHGKGNVRITRNGEVHIRDVMPNTNKVGWYLAGFIGQSELDDLFFLMTSR